MYIYIYTWRGFGARRVWRELIGPRPHLRYPRAPPVAAATGGREEEAPRPGRRQRGVGMWS